MPTAALQSFEEHILLIVGALGRCGRRSVPAGCFEIWVSHPVRVLPATAQQRCPASGQTPGTLLAQPFLGDTARMPLDRRGAGSPGSALPFGVLKARRVAASRGSGCIWSLSERAGSTRRDRSTANGTCLGAVDCQGIAENPTAGKRSVFFFPDSQLEVPLARFLSRECGMEPLESARPIFMPALMAADELALLPDGPAFDSPRDRTSTASLDRCRAARPDLTVCGLGSGQSAGGRGPATKWAIELVFSPVHGYEQAADLAELFRPSAAYAASRLAVYEAVERLDI